MNNNNDVRKLAAEKKGSKIYALALRKKSSNQDYKSSF